jgi:hypothetical protein
VPHAAVAHVVEPVTDGVAHGVARVDRGQEALEARGEGLRGAAAGALGERGHVVTAGAAEHALAGLRGAHRALAAAVRGVPGLAQQGVDLLVEHGAVVPALAVLGEGPQRQLGRDVGLVRPAGEARLLRQHAPQHVRELLGLLGRELAALGEVLREALGRGVLERRGELAPAVGVAAAAQARARGGAHLGAALGGQPLRVGVLVQVRRVERATLRLTHGGLSPVQVPGEVLRGLVQAPHLREQRAHGVPRGLAAVRLRHAPQPGVHALPLGVRADALDRALDGLLALGGQPSRDVPLAPDHLLHGGHAHGVEPPQVLGVVHVLRDVARRQRDARVDAGLALADAQPQLGVARAGGLQLDVLVRHAPQRLGGALRLR